MPLLNNKTKDWLLALALASVVIRATMSLWAMPMMPSLGFMLFCGPGGIQLIYQDDANDNPLVKPIPGAQCCSQAGTVQSVFLTPLPPVYAPIGHTQLQNELVRVYPPSLIIPPSRAPPFSA